MLTLCDPMDYVAHLAAEAETPILWLTDAKNGLIGKDLDAGKD